jgi:hypothetical protein
MTSPFSALPFTEKTAEFSTAPLAIDRYLKNIYSVGCVAQDDDSYLFVLPMNTIHFRSVARNSEH